jgi:pyruvate dehydrogenase E2 component (dihydrolipoamide acetyltransferase)
MERIREFPLPDLGEGLTEGEILKWLVSVGDTIALNQPIVEVETAKAAVEIPAKWAGKVVAIHHGEGTTVEVGTPIIAIDTQPELGELPVPSAASLAAVEIAPAEGAVEPGLIGGPAPGGRTAVLVGDRPKTGAAKRRPRKDVPAAEAATAETPVEPVAPAAVEPAVQSKPAEPAVQSRPAEPAVQSKPAEPAVQSKPAEPAGAAATNGTGPKTVALAKPPVRKLARDLGVDLYTLVGSGPSGSITRDDVQAAASQVAHADLPAAASTQREERIPIKGVRKLTAENMVASAFTAPHVTEFLTVDVTRTMKALDRLRRRPEWRDVRVSPLLMVAKAVLLGVERYPMINSTWSESTNEIIVKRYVNLGIAAATERGLIVPNIRDAGGMSMLELAEAMNGLVGTAKAGKTAPADMTGGTFTITNVGVFGVDTGTPILPPGEAAILAFGAVREMPWVHKGKIRVRQVSTLGLSFDHRIVDGELGSKFLRDVGAFLADPEVALMAWS